MRFSPEAVTRRTGSPDLLVVLLGALLVLKFVQVFIAPPTPDEAYYWLWGQNPDWSYFDHPPLNAWGLWVSSKVFGWNLIGLRAFTIFTFGFTLWVIGFWAKRLAGDEWLKAFMAGVLLLLASPLFLRFQSVAHPDHLLIAAGLGVVHFMAIFVAGLRDDLRRWRYFYAACFCVGLAGLSKYSGVFFGLGIAAWAFFSADGRRLIRHWQLYGGGLLAMAMMAPVIGWNMANDWPSLQYNLSDRIGENEGQEPFINFAQWVAFSIVMVSPVLLIVVARGLFNREMWMMPFAGPGRWIFILATGVFTALCATNKVLYYWNVPAFVFVLPVAALFIRHRFELYAAAVYGILIGWWSLNLHGLKPSLNAENPSRDVNITLGLDDIAARMAAAQSATGADLIMTTDYRTASLLAFTRGRDDVLKIGLRDDQFDFWFDQAGTKGKSAVILVDDHLPETELVTSVFETVVTVDEFTTQYNGQPAHAYRIVHARNYSGAGLY